MKTDIYPKQAQLKEYVGEYGLAPAVEGTGLKLCEIRSTYTDREPIYDHLVRVYQFYRALEYERMLDED
jgi:hypothetical protein